MYVDGRRGISGTKSGKFAVADDNIAFEDLYAVTSGE